MQLPSPVKTLREVGEALSLEKVDAPLGLRLRAWWEGCPVAEIAPVDSLDDAPVEAAVPPTDPAEHTESPAIDEGEPLDGRYWTDQRIEVAQLLWGEGNATPGGTTRTMEMIGAFGVGKKVNVLNIGAGLGGAARAIAGEFDAWVTGYEQDANLAATGAALSEKAGLAKRAVIEHAALGDADLRTNVFDCAFSREALYAVEGREELVSRIQESLKPRCPILFTDYFVAEGREDDSAVERWMASEPDEVYPWTVEQAQQLLQQSNFELRVAEDVTATYREDVFAGWAAFVEANEGRGIPDRLLKDILSMAELWAGRVAALDSGAVTVQRIIALKI